MRVIYHNRSPLPAATEKACKATRLRMASLAADNLIAALAGQRPPNLLNPAVFPASTNPQRR